MRSRLCLKHRDAARWPVLTGVSRDAAWVERRVNGTLAPRCNSESIANFPNHLALVSASSEQSPRSVVAQLAGRAAELKPTVINSEKAWI